MENPITKKNLPHVFKTVTLGDIDLYDRLTNFSLGTHADSLQQSIKEIGVTHPVTLVPVGDRFRIACGHRRVLISTLLELNEIPAWILSSSSGDESMLMLNLSENQIHRHYSAIEKGLILTKLSESNVPEGRIIEKHMPMLGLERSKKLLAGYLSIIQLTPGLQNLLHEANVPLRTFSILFRWNSESATAAENFFSILRPGANKWRDLLEWIGEICMRDEITPFELLSLPELQSVLKQNDLPPNTRYERVRQLLHSKRYPMLNDMQIRLAKALDALKLDDKTRVHIQDSFESDEIRVELKFRTREQFINQIEKLVRASGSDALDELIRIFQNPQD